MRNALLYILLFCTLSGFTSLQAQTSPDLDSAFAKGDVAELDRFISTWHTYSQQVQATYVNHWSEYQHINQPHPPVDSVNYINWLRANPASPHHQSVRMSAAAQLIKALSSSAATPNWLVIPVNIPVELAGSDEQKKNNVYATELDCPHPLLYAKNALLLDRRYDSLLCSFLEKSIDPADPYTSTAPGASVHKRIAFLNQRLHVSIDTVIRNYVYVTRGDQPRELNPYVQLMRKSRPYCSCPELWSLEGSRTIRKVYIPADGLKADVIWSDNTVTPEHYFFDDSRKSWRLKAE